MGVGAAGRRSGGLTGAALRAETCVLFTVATESESETLAIRLKRSRELMCRDTWWSPGLIMSTTSALQTATVHIFARLAARRHPD